MTEDNIREEIPLEEGSSVDLSYGQKVYEISLYSGAEVVTVSMSKEEMIKIKDKIKEFIDKTEEELF